MVKDVTPKYIQIFSTYLLFFVFLAADQMESRGTLTNLQIYLIRLTNF